MYDSCIMNTIFIGIEQQPTENNTGDFLLVMSNIIMGRITSTL